MNHALPSYYKIKPEISSALKNKRPVVALESAVITHGLPYPQNMELAMEMEKQVTRQGALPATIALRDGKVLVGLEDADLKILSDTKLPSRKISRRDFGIALARKENGGTTVTATLIAARTTGIKVFATGGIGGVHREAPFDISADLPELSRSQVVVVCAGAKSILDLPATVEYLETVGVPVVGYQTDEFPAFYSQKSGLPVNVSVDTPSEVVDIAHAHWEMGLESAILVVVPPPAEFAVPYEEMDVIIKKAIKEAQERGIVGSAVTPFLLSRVSELSGGSSLRANLALLHNNARVAAQIACSFSKNPLGKNL